MKSKLILLMLIAGGSAFAESRFSISIGGYGPGYGAGYGPGYYERPEGYYGRARPHVLYRSDPRYDRGYGAGYWGESPERRHERAEWYGLHNHQQNERYEYGDSPELREHQAQEQWHLRHEQWHERNGDSEAADGPAHGSARDGWHHDDH
jgi:hypothetical protein